VRRAAVIVALGLVSAFPSVASAGHQPIPEGPDASDLPPLIGAPADPRPVFATEPPRHPFLAPNGKSNIHVDAWQTDRNAWFGPLGSDTGRTSTFQGADCASHTFDRRGRIVTVCVGLAGPRLMMFEPETLHELARFTLPPRTIQTEGSPNPFTNFSGGGYFVLDSRDRAVIPTTTRHIWVVAETDPPGFRLERDYDLTGAVPLGDAIISALPDWSGRIWFVSVAGVVGYVDPASGAVASIDTGEPISNSFAVGEDGDVYIVTDTAMYRFTADPGGPPRAAWRVVYANDGVKKPGQTQAGSGTTPSLMAPGYVAITDNADPLNVVVLRRADGSPVCSAPIFARGASATDNSLIVTDRSIVAENNHGYTGPAATEGGASTAPGVERVDVTRGERCVKRWHSDERAPTSVPKLSLANGLVYVYTKEPREDRVDAWYLTAIDFHTGRTVYKRLAGEGLGFNNNYAPVTLSARGDAYVGVLGGLVRLADATSPRRRPLRVRLALRCVQGGVRARVAGADRNAVRSAVFRVAGRRLGRIPSPPFAMQVVGDHRGELVRAAVRTLDGRSARPEARVRACGAQRRQGDRGGGAPRFTG
jgi:hypothetical protein